MALAAATAGGAASAAEAPAPLSVIDWLSDSVRAPAVAPAPPHAPGPLPSAEGGAVTSATLDAPRPDAAGLLAPEVAGLSATLWAGSGTGRIAALIARQRADAPPAVLALLNRVLLAALEPPVDSGPDGALLLARVDKLLDLGALEPARALLEQAGPNRPESFRRWFDVSLLTGHEARACATMRATPDIAPRLAARVFCLARAGDWNSAVLTMETGAALGRIPPDEADLLARFLDADLAEEGDPKIPTRMTPLTFRILEAIGLPQPTGALPLAFAHADLAPRAGWKAQLEAAERLARSSALAPSVLFDLYAAGSPAASGGVWDRVAAVQALDVALLAGDAPLAATKLAHARAAMAMAGLEIAFSVQYGARLRRLVQATGPAPLLAYRAALLGGLAPDPEAAPGGDATARWLALLARGAPLPPPPAVAGELAQAVHAGLGGALPDASPAARLLAEGLRGEALLEALLRLGARAAVDPQDTAAALGVLEALGLGVEARRIGLELLLLDGRG
ncbi:MAG: hypothetical protein CVT80_12945 [Alphaproteobacteria bacterium HGW-Alphaproteobacteria-2]|nr:MAG: hypothetical protein CVT80_12945 [Alphaproteobacteria bacterium HGW-Alphaproteobacteria-2]